MSEKLNQVSIAVKLAKRAKRNALEQFEDAVEAYNAAVKQDPTGAATLGMTLIAKRKGGRSASTAAPENGHAALKPTPAAAARK
jgi:hypothetical protein